MRQIEEMEQKDKAVKAGPCSTQLQGSVGKVNEEVDEKRRFARLWRARKQDRGCAVREESWETKSLKTSERKKVAKHNQGNFEGKGKEEAVEKRKRPSSEEGNEAQKQQHGAGVGGSRATGKPV